MEESGWTRVRHALTAIEGQAAPIYGLSAAVAMAGPLLAGALTGHAAAGVIVALGAFLVAVRAPEGTYGQKARSLGIVVTLVTVGSLAGGLISGHRWITVAVVPPLVIVGSLAPRIGVTLPLATLLAGIRVPVGSALHSALLSLLGAALMAGLVLAPWPGRRLRPLHEAFAEVTERLAELLDAVIAPPGDPDWEKARRATSDAIARLRTTYAMYHVSSADAHPARLLKALLKLMHETVALRALIEAEAARPLHDNATAAETRAAVAVVAARVRRLAGEIDPTGPWALRLRATLEQGLPIGYPGGSPHRGAAVSFRADAAPIPSGAFQRLEAAVGEVRREAFEGDEDLVAVALAAQVERSLRRLTGIVEQAGRVVAAGIMIRPAVPRLPETPTAASLWTRLRNLPRTRPNLVRQALRAAVTILVAMIVWALMDIPHGHWLPLTTLLVLRGTYGETVRRIWQRIGGTLLGAVIAAVVLAAAPGQYWLVAVIFVLALFGFALTPVNYAFWILMNTPLMLLVVDFSEPVPWDTAMLRVGLTLLGAAIALAAARLLWPSAHLGRLPVSLARLCADHAEAIRSAEEPGEEAAAILTDKLRIAREAAGSVTTHINRMAQDPAPDTELITRLRDAVAAAHRIRDEVIAVAGMARSSGGPIAGILEELAEHLAEVAETLESAGGDSVPPEPELDGLFAEFDQRLSALARERRAEVASGVDMQDTTPLRRDLLSVAAVRHALRGLRGDVAELSRLALRT